jgi:hypothetical protein
LIAIASVFTVVLPVVIRADPAAAETLPPGFNLSRTDDVSQFVPNPTNFMFLPGTTNLVGIGKCGDIGLGRMPNADGLASTQWSNISWPSEGQVTCVPTDRGLLGIDVDGSTVYLLYNYTPGPGVLCQDGSTTTSAADGTPHIYGRLTKLTMNSATAPTSFSGEQVLMDCLPAFSADPGNDGHGDDSHTVGTVLVAPDHTLFVGNGEASSYTVADASALNAQDIHSPRGKIFHLNPDGSPAAGNPFASDGSYWATRVFAYGFRNPFRFTLAPGSNSTLYLGDVGWNNREEIDVVSSGQNFGWPCWEGPLDYRNSYQGMPACQAAYANPPANLTGPLYWWTHDVPADGHAALGGAFATGANYGAYAGAFFFGDLEWTRLWAFQQPASPNTHLLGTCPGDAFACDLAPAAGIPGVAMTAMHQGPNGDLFINDIEGHRIMELRFGCGGGNCPPTASGFVTPKASTDLNTTFTFDASASSDPDPGDTLSFQWDFGDGTGKSGAVVTHKYSSHGDFSATITVTDSHGLADALVVPVTTRNDPPTLTLTTNKSNPYSVGDPVTVTATARDQNSTPIPGTQIRWAPVLHHCPFGVASGQCHIHPQDNPTGTSYHTTVPDHGDDSYLEFVATATDSNGYWVTKSLNLPMDEHTISVGSSPPGVEISINGGNGVAPFQAKAINQSKNQLIAPPTYNGAAFVSWSDGDTNPVKLFTMSDNDVALTAIYAGPSTGEFTPVTPYRLFDTRSPDQRPPGASALQSGAGEMAFDMTGQSGMPPGATGTLLNVTTTNPAAAGYVRVYPCGTVPTISTVNFDAGQTAANLAMVKLPADSRLCFASLVPTDLVVDVAGWFSPTGQGVGSGYTTVDPVRVLDTRDPALAPGGVVAPLGGGQELRFRLAGWSGFPSDATAALLNLTVTNPQAAGYVRVYPCGDEQEVSNVNYVAGQTVANLAAVKVADNGDVCFKSYAPADLVVDLAGWFAPGTGSSFATPDPARLFDTRDPQTAPGGAPQKLPDGVELAVQITGAGVVPAGATAVALNVTAADPLGDGYVKVYPCGAGNPLVSNVNYRAHQVAAANLAVVKLPADGRVCFSSYAPTDLVVDLAGWFVG